MADAIAAPVNVDSPPVPDYIMRAIYGKVSAQEKIEAYDNNLHSWWTEYAARKNDEEQEHVADSLLYDERCHLPRTIQAPSVMAAARAAEQAAAAAIAAASSAPTATVAP
ncbi:MAG: hypothetical protein WDW38_011426 [Sanguina aurantia]